MAERTHESLVTVTFHETTSYYTLAHSMAAAGLTSDLYESQARVKIQSFDPTKQEEYEVWHASFLSTLSSRAKACIQLG